MKHIYTLLVFFIGICILCGVASTQKDWMPDPNLRRAVRKTLELPDEVPLTQLAMNQLTGLNASENQIADLAGLEYAINLTELSLGVNKIRDLSPLQGLIHLEAVWIFVNPLSDISPLANLVNLKTLDLGACQIANIRPLEDLKKLEILRLHYNQIQDITPLANLTSLSELWLTGNRIVDISPLEKLTLLEELRIQGNPITDYSPLDALSLTHFEYDEFCVFRGDPIQERIQNRSYPSIFRAWGGIINRPELSAEENYAYHDLSIVVEGDIFKVPGIYSMDPPYGFSIQGNLGRAKEIQTQVTSLNPNMLTIAAIPINYIHKDTYPDDWPYWLRNANGNRVYNHFWDSGIIDFTLPGAQDWVVERVKAVARCGLYDGILFDNWHDEYDMLGDPQTGERYRPVQDEYDAKESILTRIREYVGDDFLILVNSNRNKILRSAPYVNGIFMETLSDNDSGYTREGLTQIENTLRWAENNLREPQVNCLEGWGIPTESPDSDTNLRFMRIFTTMSLVFSDGSVLYTVGLVKPVHEHYWYDFWDADLGQPIGEKAQRYRNCDGLFIREFTNGWAVYNRSGKEQEIELPQEVSGWASGVENQRRHTLPDLDGEIYLKTIPQVAPGKYPPLYWIDAKIGALQRLVDTEVKNLVSGTQNATSLTVDTANEKRYWTEKTSNRTGKIQRANLDGRNVQLIRELTSAPLNIALDMANGKLYLSNAWGKIQRMNLDGSNFQPNLITGLKAPQNLVLDIAGGKLYWTEQISKTTGKIQRANLDGSNVQLVKELTSAPRGMTLDVTNRKLYLTNAWGKLQRMNLDGSNFQPNFITGLASPGQVVVDGIGGKLYWTEKGKLRRADLNGENIEDVVTGLGELADIGLGIDSVGEIGVAAAPAAIRTVVEQTQLLANYPNPFNPETWIPYQLSEPAEVTVRIYSVKGILVRTLPLGQTPAGIYQDRSRAAYWDGRNDVGESVASGLYFYTLTAGDFTATRKMLIRK